MSRAQQLVKDKLRIDHFKRVFARKLQAKAEAERNDALQPECALHMQTVEVLFREVDALAKSLDSKDPDGSGQVKAINGTISDLRARHGEALGLVPRGEYLDATEAFKRIEKDLTAVKESVWTEKRKAVGKAIYAMAETGTQHYDKLSQLLARNVKLANTDRDKALAELDQLSKIARAAKQKYFDAWGAATEPVRERCQAAEKSYATISKLEGVPVELLRDLRAQVDAAWTLQASRNVDAQKGAGFVLDELEAALEEVQSNAGSFAAVQVALKEAKTLIQAKALKATKPTAAQSLAEELTTLPEGVKSMLPKEALAKAQDLCDRAKQATTDASSIDQRREVLKGEIAVVEAQLKKVDTMLEIETSKKYTKYEGVLVKRLAAVKALLGKEELHPLVSAQETLKEILEQASDYCPGGNVGQMLAEQEGAMQEEEAAKNRVEQWKVTYARFQTEFKFVTAEVKKANGDLKDLAAAGKMGKNANTAATKSQDYDGAGRQLNLAREQMAQLLRFPQGAKATAKAEVEKCAKRWNDAISRLETDIGAFTAEVVHICQSDEVDPKAIKAVKATVPKVAKGFAPNVFDQHVALVASTDDSISANQRKSSREEALKLVRKYQSYLHQDPIAQHVARNPFKGGLLTELYNTLRDLDLNIQRCI